MSKYKLPYLRKFLEKNSLDIFVLSETKKQEGELLLDFKIQGYTLVERNRHDGRAGGLAAYVKDGLSCNVEVLGRHGFEGAEEWMDAERVWIKVHGHRKVAICTAYLRCEQPIGSLYYQNNTDLLRNLTVEAANLRHEGFEIVYQGDFNSHLGKERPYGIPGNRHPLNNNGRLLLKFMSEQDVVLLNGGSWRTLDNCSESGSNSWTYMKFRDETLHYSILDLVIADQSVCEVIKNFTIITEDDEVVDSDHTPMLWDLCIGSTSVTNQRNEEKIFNSTNWTAFKAKSSGLLEHRHSSFNCFVDEQYKFIVKLLTDSYKMSSVRRSYNPSSSRSYKLSQEVRMMLKKKKKLMFEARCNINAGDKGLRRIVEVRSEIRSIESSLFRISKLESLDRRKKFRNMCKKDRSKSSKAFWQYLKGTQDTKPTLDSVLTESGELSQDPKDRKRMLDKHFREKFVSVEEGTPRPFVPVDEGIFSKTDVKFTSLDNHILLSGISLEEVIKTISSLKTDSAPGKDGVSNKMLKSLSPEVLQIICSHFNMVIDSASVPEGWREGLVVLLLKRKPATVLSNYRPITLISCISKLFTKIMAKRLSERIQNTDVLGDTQQGFRKERSCLDNLLILNTLLEKQKKKECHMAFIDLTAAYDLVDRNILWKKMEKLNLPMPFINLLRSYYDDDSFECTIGNIKSNKHVLRRGLRQGCNLSPVLFSIYMSDLSARLENVGGGLPLTSKIFVNHLLFADDLFLVSQTREGLTILLSVLNGWCKDFKMQMSQSKSKVISSIEDIGWPSFEEEGGKALTLDTTEFYKYLGVNVYQSMRSTRKEYNQAVVAKARSWAGSIMRLRSTDPDKVEVSLALWKNCALPGLLYGCEVIQTNVTAIQVLEAQQNILGRRVLNVPSSSASEIVNIDLGLKPIQMLIDERRLKYFMRISKPNYGGSKLVSECIQEQKRNSGDHFFMREIDRLIHKIQGFPGKNMEIQLNNYYVETLKNEIRRARSLAGLPFPKSWWTKQKYVNDSALSSLVACFRAGNAGLGNRDSEMSIYGISDENGRVKVCQLCHNGNNNEVHLLVECPNMLDVRIRHFLDGKSLHEHLVGYEGTSAEKMQQLFRRFLNQEAHCKIMENILVSLKREFIGRWIDSYEARTTV